MLQLVVNQRQTLKEFTENNYAQGGFFWNYLLKNKEIKVNGQRVSKDVVVEVGDIVSYYLTKKQEEKPAYYTVYEDENILVIDKESGVNSEAVFAALQRERECYFIHRLDRNTSGLLAFALNRKSEVVLLKAFKERTAVKKYHALCFGKFPKPADIMTAYLKKDEGKALAFIYDRPQKDAERIVTEYKVLSKSEETTLVEVTLHTGKTHQIRAHLAHVGCPIVGDMKYGLTAFNKAKNVTRQCLVAKSLRFCFEGEFSYLNEKEWTSRFDAKLPSL